MKVTNIDLYKYFGWPKPNKYAKGILHGIFFDHELDDTELNKKRLHPMMLILPGGSYQFVSQREGVPTCISFLKYGYNTFYLEYSVAPKNKYPTMLIEGIMAITYLYKKAKDMYSDPNKISVCGYSAGGHLAGMLCSLTKEERELFYPYDKCGAHLKAAILSYPVVKDETAGHSLNNLLGEDFPNKKAFDLVNRADKSFVPTYMWATAEDTVVVPKDNAERLHNKLDELKVPNKYHLYPRGGHGLATGDINTYLSNDSIIDIRKEISSWVEEAAAFLDSVGAGLSDKK